MLSNEELRKLAKENLPPQSWFDDNDDPFEPEEVDNETSPQRSQEQKSRSEQ